VKVGLAQQPRPALEAGAAAVALCRARTLEGEDQLLESILGISCWPEFK
jgi:hypothetical protein